MKNAIIKFAGLCYNYGCDLWRFWKYASNHRVGGRTMEQRIAAIGATYHVLEKGLSMPEPRPGFGKDVVDKLLDLLGKYQQEGFDMKAVAIQSAHGALQAYLDFNDEQQCDLGERGERIHAYLASCDPTSIGGVHHYSDKELRALGQRPFAEFAASRHSIRKFADKEVDMDLIREAVRMALKTPTVCNRQSFRVYVSPSREVKDRMLNHQSGNRGFGQSADKCIVVAAELQSFFASAERNQAFVDGGLFSMSLMYALHYLGLGSCPLNWSVNAIVDRKFREEFPVPDSQVIIMMIVVGHLPEQLCVPQSNRRPLHEVFHILD